MVCPDGRSLQIGTVHNLGQNFSKAFDITFETKEGKQENIWTTSYGISGRGIAAVLIVHGDDHGLVLPPTISPIQLVIVPILYKGKQEEVNQTSKDVAEKLTEAGIPVELDLRSDLTPGNKFYYWELRGIPLRIEIGPRDIEKHEVTIVRRDTLKRQSIKVDGLVETTQRLLTQMMKELVLKTDRWKREHIHQATTLSSVRKLLKERAGIIEVLWCGEAECGKKLEQEVQATILGTPEDMKEKISGTCIVCQGKALNVVRVALTY
jgi:prolyl-tRNA synthetase